MRAVLFDLGTQTIDSGLELCHLIENLLLKCCIIMRVNRIAGLLLLQVAHLAQASNIADIAA